MLFNAKKVFLVVVVLLLCFTFSLYSATDEITVNTTVEYSKPNGTKVQGVIPQLRLGEKLNIQIKMNQKSNWNSIGKAAKNIRSYFYNNNVLCAEITIHSTSNPTILQMLKVRLVDGGFDIDPETRIDSNNLVCYTMVWEYGLKDTVAFDLQVIPQTKGDYTIGFNFCKIAGSSAITIEEAFDNGLVTFLSESSQMYSFQVVE